MTQIIQNTITVSYEEQDDSPKERLDKDGISVVRNFLCDWGDRLTLATQLMGGILQSGDEQIRTLPHQYPHIGGLSVQDVSIRPFGVVSQGDNAQEANYQKAIVSASYRRPEWGEGFNPDDETQGDTLVSESLQSAAEYLSLPPDKFTWDSAGKKKLEADEAPGLLIKMTEWIYTIHQLLSIPSGTFSLIGKVNSSSIASKSLGVTFGTETLLYQPPELEREITTEGVRAWRATYHLLYRAQGWNKFPHVVGTQLQFSSIYYDGSVFKPYDTGSFSTIIR